MAATGLRINYPTHGNFETSHQIPSQFLNFTMASANGQQVRITYHIESQLYLNLLFLYYRMLLRQIIFIRITTETEHQH